MAKDVCVLIREAGHAIPASVLTPLIQRYPRYLGIAMVKDGKVFTSRLSASPKWKMSLESIQGADIKFKGQTVVYAFGQGEDTINTADLQPYVILADEQNKANLVMFADGEFDGIAREVIAKEITPRISRAFRAAGNDVAKFMMEEMTDPIMANDILNQMVGKRGSFVVMAANDEVMRYETPGDATPKLYEWGWLSNVTGIDEPVQKEEPVEEVDPLLAAMEGSKSEVATVEKPPSATGGLRKPGASAPKAAAPDGSTGGKPADTAPSADQSAGVSEEDYLEVRVPKDCTSPKSKGNFLRKRFIGELQEDWFNKLHKFKVPLRAVMAQESPQARLLKEELDAKKPHLAIVSVKTVRALEDLGDALGEHKSTPNGTTAATQPKTSVGAGGLRRPGGKAPVAQPDDKPVMPANAPQPDVVEPKKDVAVHHLGQKSKGIAQGYLGIAPPAQLQEMRAHLEKEETQTAIDRNSQAIGHPGAYHEPEVPTFAKQLNHPQVKNFMDTMNWPKELYRDMAASAHDLAVSWMDTARWTILRQYEELLTYRAKAADSAGEEKIDQTGTGGVTKKEEAPVAPKATGLRRPGGARAVA